MKIFAYVGNQRGEESGTYGVVNEVINRLSEKLVIESVIYSPKDLDIRTCQGCGKCFSVWGECRQFNDDLNSLIKQMECADIIILASPVYIHNVTSDMKNLIDRLGVWVHLLRMVGKLGVGINYSFSSGNKEVSSYLNKVLTYWGVPIIGNLNIAQIEGEHVQNLKIDKLVIDIIESVSKIESLDLKNLQKIFDMYKRHYEKVGEYNASHPEYQYWKRKGYLEEVEYEVLFRKNSSLYLDD